MSDLADDGTPILNKPVRMFFPKVQEKVSDRKCPSCNEPISGHRDPLSVKEYQISGLCQKCQDGTFNASTDRNAYCDYWNCPDIGVGIMHHPYCGQPPGNICVFCANELEECTCQK